MSVGLKPRSWDWALGDPQGEGMDAQLLAKAVEQFRTRVRGSKSLLIARCGKIVLEEYCHGSAAGALQSLQCVTKSFISALAGIAVDQGLIRVEDRLLDYVSQPNSRGMDPAAANITIKHLLMNTPGWYWPHKRSDVGGGDEAMFNRWLRSPDYLEFLLTLPLNSTPGSEFNYNGACAWLLTAILDKVTPRGALAFAREHLFAPLGITEVEWSCDPRGQHLLGSTLKLRTRDAAKLGQLYLGNGLWGKRRVVSEKWVGQVTKAGLGPYVDLWWLGRVNGHFAFSARGGRGQALISVIPGLDMVVALTCQSRSPATVDFIEHYILPAVDEPGRGTTRGRTMRQRMA